ncbi:MAG: hypothetical protein WCW35_06620 [Bacteroidota bacterium]
MRILKTSIIIFAICANSTAQTDSTAVEDSLSLHENEQSIPIGFSAATPLIRTAPSMNPDISAIGDFRSSYSDEGPRNLDAYFNALEVQVSSVVDPYAEAKFLFSFGKDSVNGEYSAGLEIATLTSLSLPFSIQATAGRFKTHFSKVNQLHPHAFSFVEFPAVIRNYFGDEGLFMEGVSASILVPNPWDVYQEFVLDVGRSGATPSVDYGAGNRLLTTAQLNTFFDLSENSTIGFGLSGLSGVNSVEKKLMMTGFDLTYKWKPVQYNTYHSFTWQTEAMLCRSDTADGSTVKSYGAYTLFEYQIEKRTFVGVRFDYSGLPMAERSDERGVALHLRFQPSEFQVFALEYQHADPNYGPAFSQVVFRAIFGIGTHAAHAY